MSAGIAVSHIAERNFEDAILWADRALAQNRRSAVALRALAVSLAMVGDLYRARRLVQELLSIDPRLRISGLRKRLPFVNDMFQTYIDGLRAAGLPE
jgi:hypothetical protein